MADPKDPDGPIIKPVIKVFCADCDGSGTRMEPRGYMDTAAQKTRSLLTPVRCPSCRGRTSRF